MPDLRATILRTCVETPLAGDYERNIMYADACMLDCLERYEAPFLGHLLYPRVLDDTAPRDRARGIAAHLAWLRACDQVVLYVDLGISAGMTEARGLAQELNLPIIERSLGLGWLERIAYLKPTKGF